MSAKVNRGGGAGAGDVGGGEVEGVGAVDGESHAAACNRLMTITTRPTAANQS
jgi:hypothetical protein